MVPVDGLVTGIWRVSVVRAVVGVKVTVMVQVAPGARVVQLVTEAKNGVALVGVEIWSAALPVLVRVMICCVAVVPGTLLNVTAVGLKERPGSGLPKPVSVVVAGVVLVGMVRVPVRRPVVVGENRRLRKQEALGARAPVHDCPPVG